MQKADFRQLSRGLFLLFIPFLLVGILVETTLRFSREQARSDYERLLNDLAEETALRVETEPYVHRRLLGILDRFRSDPRFRAALDRPPKPLWRERDLELDLFRFGATGRLTTVWPKSAPNQWAITKLFQGVIAPTPEERERIGRQLLRVLPQTFGSGKNFTLFAASRGKVVTVFHQGQDAWVAWENGPEGGIMLFCRRIPAIRARFQAVTRDRCFRRQTDPFLRNRRFPALAIGFSDDAGLTWTCGGAPISAIPATVGPIWRTLNQSGRESMTAGDRWWTFRRTSAGTVFFASSLIPRSARPPETFPIRAGIMGLWVLAAAFLYRSPTHLTIRALTRLLFALATLVPVGGMVLGALTVLEGRHRVLADQLLRFEFETLKSLENNFSGYLNGVRKRIQESLQKPEIPAMTTGFQKALRPVLIDELQARVEIMDGTGAVLFGTDRERGGFYAVLKHFYRQALEMWAPQKIVKTGQDDDGQMSKLFAGEDLGFSLLALRPEFLHPVTSAGNQTYFYWDVFPQAVPAAFVSVFIRQDRLIEQYIERKLLQTPAFFTTRVQLAGSHMATGKWISTRIPDTPELRSRLQRAALFKRAQKGNIQVGGKPYWFTAFPATNLSDFCFLALYPDAALRSEILGMRGAIAAGLGAMLLAAFFLIRLITRRLIDPITEISHGIQALRDRDFFYRLPDLGEDEFGKLALMFNEMAAELKELDLARTVQEGLIPKQFPTLKGHSFYGIARFANDLGGDCLECRILRDGHLFFLIGDVAGHGVASALLMAFVRATTTIWVESGSSDPFVLAEQIEALFQTLEGKGTFFSACFGIYHPERFTGKCLFFGHPFPLICSPDRAPRPFGLPNYPLGSRRRTTRLASQEFTLQPGEMLLLFTDGLVESANAREEVFGYDGLANWLTGQHFASAAQALERLEAFHSRAFPVQADDITLLALLRKGGES